MNTLIIYLIQSAFCLASLYLIYWLFLRRDTFFTANRFYLIGSIILSFILPMFEIPIFYTNTDVVYVVALDVITVTAERIEREMAQNYSIYQSFLIVYLTGAAIFLIRFIFQLLQLAFLIRKFGVSKMYGLKIVIIKSKYSPFSYFNYIFLNEDNLQDKNLKNILEHEKIHIEQKHSIDLIILETLTIVQWFNPFIWLYKSSLKGIHEYLADEGLLTSGMNKRSYQNLLLNHAVGIQINDLTNNFNQSLIKKRFIMMTKIKTKKMARLKFLLVVPVAAILIVCFAFSANKKVFSSNNTEAITIADTDLSPVLDQDLKTTENQKEVFMVVEKMPEFNGGSKALMEYLEANINYPEAARKGGIQGGVYVTYVVETDGSISDIRIRRGIGGGCDEEAMRVVSAMPNWVAGTQRGKAVRVQFNLPIRFVLADEADDEQNEILAISKGSADGSVKMIYQVVEEMPQFDGGESALKDYLSANINYPEAARKAKTQGRVYVAFVVKKNGSISNIKLLRGIGGGCDEESIRVVSAMPKWIPGKQRGKKVDVQFNLPIRFILE